MKKLIILPMLIIISALALSACTSPRSGDNPSEEPLSAVRPTASDISAALAVTEEGTDSLVEQPVEKPAAKNDMINPNDFTDLTREYSRAKIKTSQGTISVKFYADKSPATVNNFLNLAKLDFYNQTKFHRVISGFMIQGGDPLSRTEESGVYGTGGPGYRFADEFNDRPLVAGSLAMANSGPNTNGSQFFIVTAANTPWLDGKHTNFGEVTAGMDIVKKIEAVAVNGSDQPLVPVVIESIELLK